MASSNSYRPMSPDLSLNTAPSMGYRPQSPDLSAIAPAYDSPLQPRQFPQYTSYPSSFQQPFPAQPQYTVLPHQLKQEGQVMQQQVKPPVDPTMGVVLKTSFPVARIKRIMQADEDIGKVAQVTPHVVSRALELFMIKLITSSADQAKGNASSKGPRRVLAQHMKRAIQTDETFDFLADIISKVPDAPSKAKKEAASDSEDAKPRKKTKRRKDSTDDV